MMNWSSHVVGGVSAVWSSITDHARRVHRWPSGFIEFEKGWSGKLSGSAGPVRPLIKSSKAALQGGTAGPLRSNVAKYHKVARAVQKDIDRNSRVCSIGPRCYACWPGSQQIHHTVTGG